VPLSPWWNDEPEAELDDDDDDDDASDDPDVVDDDADDDDDDADDDDDDVDSGFPVDDEMEPAVVPDVEPPPPNPGPPVENG
jgi:ribonuclease E